MHDPHKVADLPCLCWVLTITVMCLLCTRGEAQVIESKPNSHPQVRPILDYISSAWSVLTRSTTSCEGIADVKLIEDSVLYFPAGFADPPELDNLLRRCRVKVEHLPIVIRRLGEVERNSVQPPGLLFLEKPYVVPGGRFNEMYGWDSYFIIRGLLREGKFDLARGMVENFFFEIDHYGAVLNANRTYYLTRSQPPFLSSMIVALYEADLARGQESRAWLEKAYTYARRDYEMWIREPHLAGSTGLSRYYDFGNGPVPEGLHDEVNYYHDVLAYFLRERRKSPYLVEADNKDSLPFPDYAVKVCDDDKSPAGSAKCDKAKYVALTPEYYKGDRSMRESGFDISFRFGPYGAETHHFAPVCLNSLLYKTEMDLAKMSQWLGKKGEESQWRKQAERRRELVRSLLWSPEKGLFFDYDFKTQTLSSYVYATTFYPLWAGIATDDQARAIVKHLGLFEQQGGIAMSTQDTGVQWDYPYGWAPIQLLAVEGLRRYGYNADADRISCKFLSMVLVNFKRDQNIREKYNVVTDSSNVQVAEGYRGNIIGFGWTNGVFLELLHELPAKIADRIGDASQPLVDCEDETDGSTKRSPSKW